MLFRQHSCGDTSKFHISLEGNAEVVTSRKVTHVALAFSVAPYEKESSQSWRRRDHPVPQSEIESLEGTHQNWIRHTGTVAEMAYLKSRKELLRMEMGQTARRLGSLLALAMSIMCHYGSFTQHQPSHVWRARGFFLHMVFCYM